MKLLKRHPLLSLFNSYLVDSPAPSNLSYLWNYGSLLGLYLVVQIIPGVTLAILMCSYKVTGFQPPPRGDPP